MQTLNKMQESFNTTNDVEFMKYLLNSGNININFTDNVGKTKLHYAVESENLEMVKTLLENGAHQRIRNIFGLIPVHYKTTHEIWKLLKSSIDVICDNSGNTVLHNVVKNVEDVKFLLSLGADYNIKNNKGETAYDLCDDKTIFKSYDEKLFISSKCNLVLTKKLIESGRVNINYQDKNGVSKLHIAAANDNFDMVQMLVEKGINQELQDACGNTAFHYANINDIWNILNNTKDIKNNDGNTRLHKSARRSEFYVVKFLLELGVDYNIKNNDGKTAYELCKDRFSFRPYDEKLFMNTSDVELAKELIESGRVDINYQDYAGYTKLHRATIAKDDAMCKMLIDKGINQELVAIGGVTVAKIINWDRTADNVIEGAIKLSIDDRKKIINALVASLI